MPRRLRGGTDDPAHPVAPAPSDPCPSRRRSEVWGSEWQRAQLVVRRVIVGQLFPTRHVGHAGSGRHGAAAGGRARRSRLGTGSVGLEREVIAGRRPHSRPASPSTDGRSAWSGSGRITLGVAAVSTAVTAIVWFSPLDFASVRPQLRGVLEATQFAIALVVAFLLIGNARVSRRADVALIVGFLLLGTTNLFHAALHGLQIGGDVGLEQFQPWFAISLRGIAALLIAVAAAGFDRHHHVRRSGTFSVITATLLTVVVAVPLWIAAPTFPDAVVVSDRPGVPHLESHPVLSGAQLALVVLWGVIAVGFFRRHADQPRPLYQALMVSAVLAGFSHLNFIVYPSLYTDVVHVGDVFRLSSYLVLAIGASREIASYWRSESLMIAARERERLAREMHDGLTQELTFLRSQLAPLAGDRTSSRFTLLADSAERALLESRKIVRVLDPGGTEPPEVALARAARDVAERAGLAVHIDAGEPLGIEGAAVDELARIVREATSNAVRHAHAKQLTLRFRSHGDRQVVAISDDGVGFDAGLSRCGYGMRSMRNRATLIGATLGIDSAPGAGTTVEVALPRADPRSTGHG